MKKYIAIALSSLFLFILSCDKKSGSYIGDLGDSTFVLDVKFVYGEEDFNINQVYDYYPLDYTAKFEVISLYLSNLKLIDTNGDDHFLTEIEYVNSADSLNTFTFKIPFKRYTHFNFSIGVPPVLNGTENENFDAALYNPDHPLSLSNNMYWTWITGYRFVRIDGRSNTNPDEDEDFETLISIHTGKDYCYRSRSVELDFVADKDAVNTYTMVFDVHAFLAGENDVIDVAIDNQSHGTNEGLANRVSDNILEAITVQ